ncbi:MAG: hypothetical protein ACK4ZE_12615 [Sphingorhabdus sp.]
MAHKPDMMRHCSLFLLLLWAAPAVMAQSAMASEADHAVQLRQLDAAIREGRLTQAQQMLGALTDAPSAVYADDVALLQAEYAIARSEVEHAGLALAQIQNPDRNMCRVHAAKGWVAANQRAFDDAIIALATATENCPEDAGILNLLGLAFMGKGETMAAREAFNQAILHVPGNAQILNNHALATLQTGATEQALSELNAAIALGQKNPTILANRNFVAGMAGQMPVRVKDETDAEWGARLVSFAKGAKAASRRLQATALFSRALLTLEYFDEDVWSEAIAAKKDVH